LQNALAEKGAKNFALWVAMREAGLALKSQLKVKVQVQSQPRSTTPQPQLRKINCSLQIAPAEKAA